MFKNVRKIKTIVSIQEKTHSTKKSISSFTGTLFITGYNDTIDEGIVANSSSNKKRTPPFYMLHVRAFDNKELRIITGSSEVI